MQVPTEDRFLMRKTELENRIATLLGGRAAEEIIFKDISTGAHNDLSRATDIARSMIKEYGMSNRLGKVYFAHKDQGRFLQPNRSTGGEYSETTANMIDEEVRSIIDEQYAVALRILKQNLKILRETAETLIEREVIDGDALNHLGAKVRKVTPASGTFTSAETEQSLAA
jgi:cell division protease FtsH